MYMYMHVWWGHTCIYKMHGNTHVLCPLYTVFMHEHVDVHVHVYKYTYYCTMYKRCTRMLQGYTVPTGALASLGHAGTWYGIEGKTLLGTSLMSKHLKTSRAVHESVLAKST